MRFTPGGIPAAWGFHHTWNFGQILCGPDPVSGGPFGPEGGIGATVPLALVLAGLLVYFRRRVREDIEQAALVS